LPLFARLKETPTLKLRFAKDYSHYQEGGCYETARLETWVRSELQNLARQFDTRNRADGFTKRLSISEELLAQYAKPFGASAPKEGKRAPKKRTEDIKPLEPLVFRTL
jgi:hypothetical protein